MNLRVNRDGKLWDRVVGAAIPLGIGLVPVVFLWWRDASISDTKAADGLSRLEVRLDKVETEARDARRSAAEDRQKTAELAADLRNVARGVNRIEGILDRWSGPPPPPLRP